MGTSKDEKLREMFSLSASEPIIEDFGCALLRDVPIHGRLYLTHDHVLFHAQVFRFSASEKIPFTDIVSVEKANTALVIPNAIAVTFRSSEVRERNNRKIREGGRVLGGEQVPS
jgi:hypothetical protein